jgi:hypothetical protein
MYGHFDINGYKQAAAVDDDDEEERKKSESKKKIKYSRAFASFSAIPYYK